MDWSYSPEKSTCHRKKSPVLKIPRAEKDRKTTKILGKNEEEARNGGNVWEELKVLSRNMVRWSCFVDQYALDKSKRTY